VRELLLSLARALVDEPEQVRVTEHPEGNGSFLELRVAAEDRGRVIGKKGRTADALRTLLDAVARQRGTHCDMEIMD
jgi:predicted RNA-binding protein YlqC (UPF0109 family)